MKYTGPKRKLCRREKRNLFGVKKYDLKKSDNLPGQHGSMMSRNSEYGILLRNKQSFKRTYLLHEKQFAKLVTHTAKLYSKNKKVSHDKAVVQFLERRCDSILLQAGVAKTIMQARQMVVHGHRLLNGEKHNIPSSFMDVGDVLTLRKWLQTSSLYEATTEKKDTPVWLKVDKNNFSVTLLQLPEVTVSELSADVLKVIEFYARV